MSQSLLPFRMHPGCRVMFALAIQLSLAGAVDPAIAQPGYASEYRVKAAFLLNFAQFVQWPAYAFASAESPITVGVLGDDPFGAAMDEVFNGETVQGRSIVIRRSHQIEDLTRCQILFICRDQRDRLGEILAAVSAWPVLTVSEMDDFTRRGGIVNFYIENNKVRFEINPRAAERKGLKINAELLKRAKIVGMEQP